MIAVDGCESAALAGCRMEIRLGDGRRIAGVPGSQPPPRCSETGEEALLLEGQAVRLADIVEITFRSPIA